MTNENCIHYLAYHREEVPEEQLIRVANLNDGQKKPSKDELENGMEFFIDERKAMSREEYIDFLSQRNFD